MPALKVAEEEPEMKTMNILACCLLATSLATPVLAGPQPIGDATITVSYPLIGGGTYTAVESRNFNGTNPSAATAFGVDSNMSMFSSAPNVFGRRAHVASALASLTILHDLVRLPTVSVPAGGDTLAPQADLRITKTDGAASSS